MIDKDEAKHVEIYIDSENRMWINVNGVCKMRIGTVEHIDLNIRGLKFSPICAEKVT